MNSKNQTGLIGTDGEVMKIRFLFSLSALFGISVGAILIGESNQVFVWLGWLSIAIGVGFSLLAVFRKKAGISRADFDRQQAK